MLRWWKERLVLCWSSVGGERGCVLTGNVLPPKSRECITLHGSSLCRRQQATPRASISCRNPSCSTAFLLECPWQACDSQQNRGYSFSRMKLPPTAFKIEYLIFHIAQLLCHIKTKNLRHCRFVRPSNSLQITIFTHL